MYKRNKESIFGDKVFRTFETNVPNVGLACSDDLWGVYKKKQYHVVRKATRIGLNRNL